MEKITLSTVINPTTGEVLPGEMDFQVASLAGVSDGYHTIAELYDHRITLFIALCKCIEDRISENQQAIMGRETDYPSRPWRSQKHSDGELAFGGGWYVLGIYKEKGKQITYHLPMSRWDESNFAETLDTAPEWDGHTSEDVIKRLKAL